MNSNPLMMISQMIASGRSNPGAMVQQIMAQNPQFAQMVRGQNPRQLAEQSLRQMGIDPAQIGNMVGGGMPQYGHNSGAQRR